MLPNSLSLLGKLTHGATLYTDLVWPRLPTASPSSPAIALRFSSKGMPYPPIERGILSAKAQQTSGLIRHVYLGPALELDKRPRQRTAEGLTLKTGFGSVDCGSPSRGRSSTARFGGVTVVLAGDPKQCLPIIPSHRLHKSSTLAS
ncbi:BZ3501_MvSof-1269-A2-R1_Chr12-3g03590 [Microbotryum saponariae]|nr:BZ3501_MvSof-1269-A2-R1_Chr12-3g03590 [Microbotryum saponariae]